MAVGFAGCGKRGRRSFHRRGRANVSRQRAGGVASRAEHRAARRSAAARTAHARQPPEGTDVSALHHLLQNEKTIRPDRGLFLNETFRLHPDICAYTSELFYEGRLRPRPGLEAQSIRSGSGFSGSGLRYVAVPTEGNQSSSPEEADCARLTPRSANAADPLPFPWISECSARLRPFPGPRSGRRRADGESPCGCLR